jgi:aminopeptidase
MWASDARLADLVVSYCVDAQPGETVLLESPSLTSPLVHELYRRVLSAGAHPLPRIEVDGAQELFLREAGEPQLDWVNPRRADDLRLADARVVVYAEWNSRALTGIDPARQARVARAYQPIGTEWMERAARGELKWVVVGYPSSSGAQDAEMSLEDYADFVHGALLLHEDDPAEAWRAFAAEVLRIEDVLNETRELRVVGDGTDLRLSAEGRTWVGSVGRENMPDGEVFTGPVESSVEGTIRFSFPAIFHGREVEDVRLRFEGGEVVEATALRGQDYLREMIAMDDGARRVGEFAFGLNDGIRTFTKNLLFDEKIGGTVHLALGASYPETGGVNRSGLHWDMICDLRDGSEVFADGELVYRDGRFVV